MPLTDQGIIRAAELLEEHPVAQGRTAPQIIDTWAENAGCRSAEDFLDPFAAYMHGCFDVALLNNGRSLQMINSRGGLVAFDLADGLPDLRKLDSLQVYSVEITAPLLPIGPNEPWFDYDQEALPFLQHLQREPGTKAFETMVHFSDYINSSLAPQDLDSSNDLIHLPLHIIRMCDWKPDLGASTGWTLDDPRTLAWQERINGIGNGMMVYGLVSTDDDGAPMVHALSHVMERFWEQDDTLARGVIGLQAIEATEHAADAAGATRLLAIMSGKVQHQIICDLLNRTHVAVRVDATDSTVDVIHLSKFDEGVRAALLDDPMYHEDLEFSLDCTMGLSALEDELADFSDAPALFGGRLHRTGGPALFGRSRHLQRQAGKYSEHGVNLLYRHLRPLSATIQVSEVQEHGRKLVIKGRPVDDDPSDPCAEQVFIHDTQQEEAYVDACRSLLLVPKAQPEVESGPAVFWTGTKHSIEALDQLRDDPTAKRVVRGEIRPIPEENHAPVRKRA